MKCYATRNVYGYPLNPEPNSKQSMGCDGDDDFHVLRGTDDPHGKDTKDTMELPHCRYHVAEYDEFKEWVEKVREEAGL